MARLRKAQEQNPAKNGIISLRFLDNTVYFTYKPPLRKS